MSTSENYKYWKENGSRWLDEYNQRRSEDFYFTGQEILLHHFMTMNKVRSVLDYGCGVGRHMRHLLNIEGLDVFGYDQSPTMIAEIACWAKPEWQARNVRCGPPTGPIPLADRAVEVSFTSEVLLHSRAEDIAPILAELLRVSRRGVIHLEPHADYPLRERDHGGCWYHDLVGAYESLGVTATRAGRPFYSQEVVLARLDPDLDIDRSFILLLADIDAALRPALERSRRRVPSASEDEQVGDDFPIPFFLRGPLPPQVAVMQAPASEAEVAEAEEVRRRFYLPDGPTAYVVDIVRAFRPVRGASAYVEIGSRDKGNIAWVANRLAPDALIVDVDLTHIPDASRRLEAALPAGQIYRQVMGDSGTLATRDLVKASLNGRKADAVFLASGHLFNHVLREINLYFPLLRAGGLLIIHDVFWEGDLDAKGKAQALSLVDRHIPVWALWMNEPVRRFYPLEARHSSWGGVGILVRSDSS